MKRRVRIALSISGLALILAGTWISYLFIADLAPALFEPANEQLITLSRLPEISYDDAHESITAIYPTSYERIHCHFLLAVVPLMLGSVLGLIAAFIRASEQQAGEYARKLALLTPDVGR